MKDDSPEKTKILIVDDEPQITRVLRMACVANGYQVEDAPDGQAGLAAFEHWRPDLIITDLSMPNLNGVELCREIRKHSTVPIIVLSVRDQEKIKVQALDAGADDYVTKPFQTNELLARVRSVLRRSTYVSETSLGSQITAGDFFLDADSHQAFVRGVEVRLTPKEFSLLHYMMLHPERILTRRTLLVAIWGAYSVDQPESLRVLVGQLRRKIEPSEDPRYILTEPWIGYRFIPSGTSDPSL